MLAGIKSWAKLWGFNTQGDWGPVTMYTSQRKRLVVFLKAPPDKPPSAEQRNLHGRFAAAARAWSALPPATKAAWRRAAARAHLRIGANALYTHAAMMDDWSIVHTIARQTGIPLPRS